MAQFSRTWWGRRFIEALEQFTDPARLGRGRSYASGGRILDYTVADGTVTARVRGSINPYFGVYKEPIYRTSITIKSISRCLSDRASASPRHPPPTISSLTSCRAPPRAAPCTALR